ncbi:MAG: hypothetical protein SFU98_20535 [Leptospiraceae bacterium]|nr:hypothetical protein [Leptospiraceae bacterium]
MNKLFLIIALLLNSNCLTYLSYQYAQNTNEHLKEKSVTCAENKIQVEYPKLERVNETISPWHFVDSTLGTYGSIYATFIIHGWAFLLWLGYNLPLILFANPFFPNSRPFY